MQPGRTPTTNAEPPGIDELSERLSALATRSDTLNGGRQPTRSIADKPAPRPASKPASRAASRPASTPGALIKALVAPRPEASAKAPAGQAPHPASAPHPGSLPDADGRLWPRIPAPGDTPATDPRARIAELETLLRERDRRI